MSTKGLKESKTPTSSTPVSAASTDNSADTPAVPVSSTSAPASADSSGKTNWTFVIGGILLVVLLLWGIKALFLPSKSDKALLAEERTGAAATVPETVLEEDFIEEEEGVEISEPMGVSEQVLTHVEDEVISEPIREEAETQEQEVMEELEKVAPEVDDDRIYETVEENASFPGGDNACYEWLSSHIHYPSNAMEQGIQGRVIVQFVVNADGSIVDVQVLRSPDASLSKEAERVIRQMPKWKPARQGGKFVRSRFNLPVMFRLS